MRLSSGRQYSVVLHAKILIFNPKFAGMSRAILIIFAKNFRLAHTWDTWTKTRAVVRPASTEA